MVPGLREGEFLLVDRVAYLHDEGSIFAGILPGTSQGALRYPFGGPRRGDVVVFNSPTQPDIELVKRVIGLPGENLRIQAGRVFVNETPLDEPYTAPGSTGIDSYPDGAQPVRVPDDSYFVLGDNRVVSQDSRQGWFVRADTLVGRAWLAYWPPSAWGFVSQISPTAVTQSGPATQRAVATAVVAPAVTPVPVSTAVPAAVPTPGRQAPATGPAIPLSGAVSDEPGWPSDPTGTAWFVGSSYHLSANRATQFVAIAAPVPDVYADVQVTAMFHKIGGPPGGGYGIIVRDEGPGPRDGINQGGRYYVAEVGDRGEVGIWRRENDHWVDLQPWTRSEAVFVGGTTNELTLRAQGSKLTFAVNGHDVSSVSDGALASGRVGAFVGGDFNEVILDRFTIEVPPAGVAP
jgi:signal peptidase I